MQKQKKGFWLFICSLIPGAGEMYMGFRKQGLSMMILFWSIFALGAGTGMDWLICFTPIVWCYSFFSVHNLKSLSEEEFYSVEDSYVLHLDELIGDTSSFVRKYRPVVAVLLIVFGISILWNNLIDIVQWILPEFLLRILGTLSYNLPQIVIAVAIILAGIYLLSNKREKLQQKTDSSREEHYWEPYRPYQQPAAPAAETEPEVSENEIEEVSEVSENKTEEEPKVPAEE